MRKFKTVALTVAFCASSMVPALAQSNGQPNGEMNHPPHQPPPQAFQACNGHSAGDTVEITPPGRQPMQATCTQSPQGLFARPEHHRHGMEGEGMNGGGMRPPPQNGGMNGPGGEP